MWRTEQMSLRACTMVLVSHPITSKYFAVGTDNPYLALFVAKMVAGSLSTELGKMNSINQTEVNMKLISSAAITGTFLTLISVVANANPSLMPSISSPEDADKTIVIKDSTKYVNVFDNETVLFKSGANQFAIKFDGVRNTYNLAKLAPAGLLTHSVRVYVSPSPTDPEQGKP
jgi:hypothetical protein